MEERDMLQHDDRLGFFSGWHLDKRVSIAHLLATIGFAFGLASWQWAEHERVTVLQKDLQAHELVDVAEKTALNTQLSDIKETDKETLMAMNRQYAEILQRLSSIDKNVTTHLENHGRTTK